MTPTVFVALLAIAVTIILAIVSSTWLLSSKLGDVRVAVAEVHEVATKNDSKVDAMWSWWNGDRRPPSAPVAVAQRVTP